MLEAIIVILGIGIDQLTKIWAQGALMGAGSMKVLPGVVKFTYVENTGAAFGMLGSATIILTIVSAIAAIAIAALLIVKRRTLKKPLSVMMSLILAGAVGNLIDRIIRGFVVDFIEFDFFTFPVFNVADCFVSVGAAALVIYILFFYDKKKRTGEETAANAEAADKSTAIEAAIEAVEAKEQAAEDEAVLKAEEEERVHSTPAEVRQNEAAALGENEQ